MQPKYRLTSLCDENCGEESLNRPTDTQTDTQADRRKDRKVETEGPKVMYIDVRYLRTVVIGGPKCTGTTGQ